MTKKHSTEKETTTTPKLDEEQLKKLKMLQTSTHNELYSFSCLVEYQLDTLRALLANHQPEPTIEWLLGMDQTHSWVQEQGKKAITSLSQLSELTRLALFKCDELDNPST